MTVACTAITTSTSINVVSAPTHDEGWWAAEAARTGSDWPGVIDAAFEMMAAGGIHEPEPTMTAWDVPSWRHAAVEYHRDRPGRPAVEIEPKRLARLRRLMADDVSLERAWHGLRDKHSNFQTSDFR